MEYGSGAIPSANTEEEWRALLEGDDSRIIRSREDWDGAMAEEDRRSAILPGCDQETVRAFSEGLIFRNGGLAGANYSMLEDRLTYRQFKAVWNNFGIGEELFQDYNNKECSKPATCSPLTACICTSNC